MKLIDGDKLISTLVWGHYGLGNHLQIVQKAVDDMRGEDAVPIIRCKDCRYCVEKKSTAIKKHCIWWYRSVDDDDYCSRAERREDVDD